MTTGTRRPPICSARRPAGPSLDSFPSTVSRGGRPMRTTMLLRILSLALVLLAIGFFGDTSARAGDGTGQVNFVLGQKMLDKNDWEPFDQQIEDGAEVSWGKKS